MKQPPIMPASAVAFWRLRRSWPIVALLVLCLLFAAGGDELRQLTRYDRQGLEHGEYWRLVSAHVVHLGMGHLWPNVAALVVIGLLFDDVFGPAAWWWAAIASAAAIDGGLYVLDPGIDWYVGLSGVLHGFVAAGALTLLARRQLLGVVLAVGLGAKLAFEQTAGPVPFTAASVGGPIVVAAHLYGTVGGALAAGARLVVRRRGARV